mmetsp:Transcript_43575/g.85323  ORF Transcript_43575/g.85323 Transcript_43575/m.85323 type:complete len:201 (+) Transcript_43575:1140-1742(+)
MGSTRQQSSRSSRAEHRLFSVSRHYHAGDRIAARDGPCRGRAHTRGQTQFCRLGWVRELESIQISWSGRQRDRFHQQEPVYSWQCDSSSRGHRDWQKTCFAPRTVQGQRYHKAAVRFLRRERHDSDDRVPVPCFPALFRERPDLAVRLAHPQHQEQACGDHQPKGPASAGSAPQPSKAQGLLREPPVHLPQRKHPCAFPS